jgi:DNA (cytosine-5)-methyltransferase 1
MTHGSLFSGIGGFDLAAEWMGWENVFHCEWNPFGQKVLKYYWPNAISYHDITKTDFTIHRGAIDILTGGFPCQPYSAAGKRLGKEDERHLWPSMLRAIREIQPRWIVGENVLGLVNWNGGMVFEEVQADLEAEGYEVQPYVLPAAAVGAPHRRDRVWFVAYSTSARAGENFGGLRSVFDRCNTREENATSITNTMQIRLQQCKDNGEMGGGQTEMGRQGSEFANAIETNGEVRNAPNTSNKGLQRCKDNGSVGEIRKESQKFSSRRICQNWDNFPTVSPICSRNDGLSNRLDGITFSKWRTESIKAGGNAIVPQVVYQIFKAIEKFELNKN